MRILAAGKLGNVCELIHRTVLQVLRTIMSSEAAKKAWETRRRRAAGESTVEVSTSSFLQVDGKLTILDRINRDITEDKYYTQNFTNAGERFIAWYLRNIYLRTPVQARDDITDGQDDKGIDAIFIDDDQRQIIVIQGKFYNESSVDHEPLQEILSAWLQLQDLESLQENANQRVKIKLEAVRVALKDDYEIVFEIVTTGTLTNSAENDLVVFQDALENINHPIMSLTLVESHTLQTRLEEAAQRELPKLTHSLTLESGRYLALEIANYKTVLAAVPLAMCVNFPGIRDGSLFRKNVRQSLGLTNKVNKGLKQTLTGETPEYFFLFHNGITALCDRLQLDPQTNRLELDGLSVVNGCQSLSTILACSEKAKAAKNGYVLFRFYEIPQRDVADKIGTNTNSQSAVKARDLRSNDKRILSLKRSFENTYRDGFMITKRGEKRPADRDEAKTIDVSQLVKWFMSWHCQRPNIAYNENRLFDEYFDKIMQSDYPPQDLLALRFWASEIDKRWDNEDLGLHEQLQAASGFTRYYLLFAVAFAFSVASNQQEKVPNPSATVKASENADAIIAIAANCCNSALENAVAEAKEKDKLFNPLNWFKTIDAIRKVQASARMYINMLGSMPGGVELKKNLILPADQFVLRWSAD
jgi:AIPR protein